MSSHPVLDSPILLARAAALVAESCAPVAPGDNCLIVTDASRRMEAEALVGAIHSRGGVPLLLDVTCEVAKYHQTKMRPEPPPPMAAAFNECCYVFAVADVEYNHLLGHTARNQAAQDKGMQYVVVEEDMWTWTATPADIDACYERNRRVAELLRQGKWVLVTTAKGSDLRFKLKPGRKVWSFGARTSNRREALIVPHYGESACVPEEGYSEGRAVIDGHIISVGVVREPVEIIVRQGRAVEVNGGREAAQLRATMAAAGENADNIAECGICMSHLEKRAYEYPGAPGHYSYGAWGTTHLALGHSKTIGGDVSCKIHLDCQMYDTTVHIDDVCVMEKGTYPF
jgi:leucyl aminopeptidase (aminopeptidase T)